jgi:hypothetical protein
VIKAKKGVDASAAGLKTLAEGRSLQVMHIGPYDQVCPTYGELTAYIVDHELTVTGPPHEIYLSDPRRTAAEKLKTIVRVPVG